MSFYPPSALLSSLLVSSLSHPDPTPAFGSFIPTHVLDAHLFAHPPGPPAPLSFVKVAFCVGNVFGWPICPSIAFIFCAMPATGGGALFVVLLLLQPAAGVASDPAAWGDGEREGKCEVGGDICP